MFGLISETLMQLRPFKAHWAPKFAFNTLPVYPMIRSIKGTRYGRDGRQLATDAIENRINHSLKRLAATSVDL